jgi:multidrug resistance efflux pump
MPDSNAPLLEAPLPEAPLPDAPLPDAPLPDAPLKLVPARHGAAPRLVPVLITLILVAAAAASAWAAWDAYVAPPWTRDGTVRANVVTLAPEISGRIITLPVTDNQYVRRGDLLVGIDATDYAIAVDNAQANLEQARINEANKQAEAQRRRRLTDLSTSDEERQTYISAAQQAAAGVAQALAALAQAKVNLERTRITSPVDGFVTNLEARVGDYGVTGQRLLTLVDADSFWIDGYFEETELHAIHDGDHARARLIGWHDVIDGHVAGVARGIVVPNATSDASGLATVNPIFTWVRLAQRVPVHITIDHLPNGMRLVAGQTASVEIVR